MHNFLVLYDLIENVTFLIVPHENVKFLKFYLFLEQTVEQVVAGLEQMVDS